MGSAKLVLVAGVCVSVGALVGPTLTTAAVEKVEDVFVTNAVSDPVPISVVGSPTVSVGNTPTVSVGNTPTVAEAGTPVQFRGTMIFQGSQFASSDPYVVPADKRLRVDHVSFHDGGWDPTVDRLSLQTLFDGQTLSHSIVTHSQGPEGDVASQPIVAYSDPESHVRFFLNLDQVLGDDSSTVFVRATFTGVLLDA